MTRGAGRNTGDRLLDVLACAVLALMALVGAQVALSLFDINPVVVFAAALPLLGEAVTLNSLLDLQWHLFALIALLPSGLVLLRGRHVRVDFIYAGLSARRRRLIDLAGHLVFAAPFFVMAVPAGWDFTRRAWLSDEGSRSGGLSDLWLIKAVLPLGLGLLALAVAWEAVRLIRRGGGDG